MEKRENRGDARYVLKLRAALLLNIYLHAFFAQGKREREVDCLQEIINYIRAPSYFPFFIPANKFRKYLHLGAK